MWRKFCGWLLKVWGWEKSTFLPPEPKCILLGVPHTSMLDFVVAYLFYVSIGGKTFCMVKSSLFFPPLGWILRAIGGIPVDRKHPASVVRSVLKEMEKTDLMHLAIAPEGATILHTQATGDEVFARDFIARYAVLSPSLTASIVSLRLEKIPVDIRLTYEK